MGLQVANQAWGTLASGISSTSTTITLNSGQGARFPAASVASGNYFYATLFNAANVLEVVKVTDRTGDVLTVTRGQDGTTAQAYSSGDSIEVRPCAAVINDLVSLISSLSTTKAPLDSAALTGTPTAPTAAADTTTTQLATTAFVIGQAGTTTPAMNGTATVGTSKKFARDDHIHPTDSTRAPLASPALTGTPLAPTPAAGTNTTQIATTEFVATAIANAKPSIVMSAVAASFSPVAADQGKNFYHSGAFTYTLPDASTVPNGYYFYITFDAGSITINPATGQTLNCAGLTNGTGLSTVTHPNANGWENVIEFLVVKYSNTAFFVIPLGASHGGVTFTASGSWVAPSGVTAVWVSGIGGGGSGANGSNGTGGNNSGGGGGSGDMVFRKKLTVTPGTSYTITVGAAGASSSFGALLTLAAGGAASGTTGGTGGGSFGSDGDMGGGLFGGTGGFGPFGGGAKGNTAAPANTGAGGGGGQSGTSAGGSAGASGVMVIEW